MSVMTGGGSLRAEEVLINITSHRFVYNFLPQHSTCHGGLSHIMADNRRRLTWLFFFQANSDGILKLKNETDEQDKE